ncbi:hypothetical protein M8C21_030536 [Ambrosia artemisiifolia]|uniref:Uncharacterized protein n=1 Tax=Ambrosia artemisiifolia TaxID=4212 RepID=A0AAD5GGC6_AMBAR|nr:hypothetical protein M8C21_030536 [Ambrosia artemisiifolia]
MKDVDSVMEDTPKDQIGVSTKGGILSDRVETKSDKLPASPSVASPNFAPPDDALICRPYMKMGNITKIDKATTITTLLQSQSLSLVAYLVTHLRSNLVLFKAFGQRKAAMGTRPKIIPSVEDLELKAMNPCVEEPKIIPCVDVQGCGVKSFRSNEGSHCGEEISSLKEVISNIKRSLVRNLYFWTRYPAHARPPQSQHVLKYEYAVCGQVVSLAHSGKLKINQHCCYCSSTQTKASKGHSFHVL